MMAATRSSHTSSLAETQPRLLLSDVVLVGLGSSTAILAALLLAIVATTFHVAVYGALFWGVIPAGAFFCGGLSASGYALGAKVIGRRPGRLVKVAVFVGGPVTLLLVYAFQYLLLDVNGVPVHQQLSFWSFVDASIRATSISYKMRIETGSIGVAGYPFAVLNLVGFCAGSAAILTAPWLSAIACDRCARFMPAVTSASGYGTLPPLGVQFSFARRLLLGGETRAAMDLVAGLSQTDADYRMTLDVTSCDTCRRDYHHLRLLKWQTDARPPWVPVKDFNLEGQVSALTVPQHSGSG